ncbi:MAG: efflux RND transporter periplasmic adaptor subunit [Deltaproteobacteria bacterium]|nr:efflux RND transporter periplasmic adaptor subunit [Deltaproteobacteria bacterium]
MTNLRKILLASVPLALVGALWAGHQTSSASASTSPAVQRAAVITAPARVEPLRDPVALAFETTGRIVEVDVDEGQAVHAGDVLARLDDRLPKARVASAQAQVAAAEARYSLARRGPRHEDVEAARAEADAAAAEAQHRGAERTRSEKLGEAGALASSAVDADDAAARVASSNATAATARYQSLAKGTRTEQIAEASAALDAARAELDAAKIALDQTVLRSPHDGVVLRRLAEVGTLVTTMAPAPVVTVADLSKLEVRAEIDEADVAAIAVGKSAYATADAFGDRHFPVRISRITHELGRKTVRDDDPRARVDTRVLEVIAQFDGAPTTDLPLGLRMYVHVDR